MVLETLVQRWFSDNFIRRQKKIVDARKALVLKTDPRLFVMFFVFTPKLKWRRGLIKLPRRLWC